LDPRPLPYQSLQPDRQLSFDLAAFERFVRGKYAKTTAPKVICYVKKYSHILQQWKPGEIELVPATRRNDVIKSLITLSKYLGVYEEFKRDLKNHGIKLKQPDALSAFTRLYTNHNNDLGEWLTKVKEILRPEEILLLKFLRTSGLRKEEGITAFNIIIELSKQGKIDSYLNENGVLEHFRFKEKFLRGTKNVFISIVPANLISEIANSQPVTYAAIVKKLQRRKVRCRINELRDFFGTFMIKHGLIREEIDLLQGRIGVSIFTRHYFSPALIELRDRTLKALTEMGGETIAL
jgi:intergrase/recombinase